MKDQPIKLQLNSEAAIRSLIEGDPDLELEIKNKISCAIAKGYDRINAGVVENSVESLTDTLRGLIEDSKELIEAKEKIAELEDKVTELNSDLINIKLGRSTRNDIKEDIGRFDNKNVKCAVTLKDEGTTKYEE